MTCSERATLCKLDSLATRTRYLIALTPVVVIRPKISLEACRNWPYGACEIWVPRAHTTIAAKLNLECQDAGGSRTLKDHYECQWAMRCRRATC